MQFPADLYSSLLAVWRSSRPGRRADPRGGGHAAPHGLSPDELHAVSRSVRELSRGFTRDRTLAGERYLSDPDLLGAYLLHFWPISYSQARVCLEMLWRAAGRAAGGLDAGGHATGGAPRSVLDVGAGPGAVSLALLDVGALNVTACDRSAAALALARRVAAERGHELATRPWDALKTTGLPRGPFDMICLGHTLNELWQGHPDRISLRVQLLLKLAGELAPDGRLFIMEPALTSTTQEAIRVRDGMVAAGFSVEMPCIWQEACPALPDGTCHGEFEWNPPTAMVRLAHAARIGRETLKVAWFVLRKNRASTPKPVAARDGVPDGGLYRVVSDPLLSKSGRVRYLVCGPMGRFALSASRTCRAPQMRRFFNLARGDGIRFTGATARETGWGLDEGSRLEVVERTPRQGPAGKGSR